MKISLSSVALIISLNRSDRRRRRGARMVFAAPATRRIRCTRINRPANPRRVHRDAPLRASPPHLPSSFPLSLASRDEYFFIRLFHFAVPHLVRKNGLSSQDISADNASENARYFSSRIRRAYLLRKVRPSKIIYRVSRWLFPAGCGFFYEPSRGRRRQKKIELKLYKC